MVECGADEAGDDAHHQKDHQLPDAVRVVAYLRALSPPDDPVVVSEYTVARERMQLRSNKASNW